MTLTTAAATIASKSDFDRAAETLLREVEMVAAIGEVIQHPPERVLLFARFPVVLCCHRFRPDNAWFTGLQDK